MSAYYLVAAIEHLVAVVERLVVAVEHSYSPITLFFILTIGVVLGSRRQANKVVEAFIREKATIGVVAGAISLL